MNHRFRKLPFILLLVVLAAALFVPAAMAHATLLRSDPADGAVLPESPREVRLWFDEEISAGFSTAQLLDAGGRPVSGVAVRADSTDPTLLIVTPPPLPDGVYSVLYKVLSNTDGHFSQGLLVFGVGEGVEMGGAAAPPPEPPPPLAEVILRWLNFGLLAGIAGALAMRRWVLRPAPGEGEAVRAALATARQGVRRWAALCAGAALAVGLLMLGRQVAVAHAALPAGSSLWTAGAQVVGNTQWGQMWLVRQAILLAMGGLLLAAPRRWTADALGGLAVALLTAQALGGHAAAVTPNTALAVAADTLHLLAASLWVGGLLALAVALLPLLRGQPAHAAALIRAGWRPFGGLAAFSVAVLFATGLYNTGRQVASVDALVTTLYGRVLLGKIGLVLGVGLFGLLNSMLLHPRVAAPLARLLRRPAGWTPLSVRRLPQLVRAELLLGLLVLLATGVITAAPAPRSALFTVSADDVPEALTQTVDNIVVTLQVKPNRPGQNVFTIFAASAIRPAPAEIIRVQARFSHLEQDVGVTTARAEEVEPGRYLISGNYLSLAGPWQIDVVVRRRGMEDSVARFYWVVAPPGQAQPVVISKRPIQPYLTLGAAALMLALAAALAVTLAGTEKPAPQTET